MGMLVYASSNTKPAVRNSFLFRQLFPTKLEIARNTPLKFDFAMLNRKIPTVI
jgi:hypothetical protein